MKTEEQLQQKHYDEFATRYNVHRTDEYSQLYTSIFIVAPLIEGIELNQKDVLEAMCGGGTVVTSSLITKGAKVTGLDISANMLEYFRFNHPGVKTIAGSILDTDIESNSFDGVVVIAGLHHLHPHLDVAIDEIYRILKPGGFFLFVEPHSGSVPDFFRRIWYKFDRMFESNEAALNIEELEQKNHSRFEFTKKCYFGNVAFLLVLQSVVWRVPLWLKNLYSPLFLKVEKAISPFLGKKLSCNVICSWRKR